MYNVKTELNPQQPCVINIPDVNISQSNMMKTLPLQAMTLNTDKKAVLSQATVTTSTYVFNR